MFRSQRNNSSGVSPVFIIVATMALGVILLAIIGYLGNTSQSTADYQSMTADQDLIVISVNQDNITVDMDQEFKIFSESGCQGGVCVTWMGSGPLITIERND